MKLIYAKLLADEFIANLKPYCDRIEVAGSVRRKKPEVKDIEIVCIPKIEKIRNLIGIDITRSYSFINTIIGYKILKGKPDDGKYIQLELPTIKLDLFMATSDNWGLIYSIRTGSSDFSHNVLAKGWVRQGYKSIDGMLTNVLTGEKIPVKEEKELFRLIKVKYIEPEFRL